jgi:hypothetical protein
MTSTWPWYEIVNSATDLQQGDILEGVPIPELSPGSETAVERQYNLITMTQSCDIEANIPQLIFCPLWTQDELSKAEPKFGTTDYKEKLRRGYLIGFHPISRSTLVGLERPWRIVEFQRIIEMKSQDVFNQVAQVGLRLRLLPPYREHLAQQFARFFMRIGLPVPVDFS